MELKELYQEIILDHAKNPRNKGKCEGYNHDAKAHNPLCGDKVHIYLKLEKDKVLKEKENVIKGIYQNLSIVREKLKIKENDLDKVKKNSEEEKKVRGLKRKIEFDEFGLKNLQKIHNVQRKARIIEHMKIPAWERNEKYHIAIERQIISHIYTFFHYMVRKKINAMLQRQNQIRPKSRNR